MRYYVVYYNRIGDYRIMLEEEKIDAQEAKVEEAQEAPKAPEAKNKKNPVIDVDECVEFSGAENVDEIINSIESQRKALLEMFKRSKLISRIVMAVVVAAVIAAIILIFNNDMTLKIIGYSIAGVVLVAMVVYYIISKDKFPKSSKEYIAKVTESINSYDFEDKRFSNLKYYPNKKLTKTELEVDRAYKNSSEIGSRNFISGLFDSHKFEVSENVLYSLSPQKKNQRSVLFLGKYITFENSLKFEGRYIINIKGNPEKLIDQPNDIEDLNVALEEDNVVIYAPNDKAPKDVLGSKFISKVKDIKTDDRLLNAVVVIWAGHTAVYLSYDDSVTVLPFEHEFNKAAQDKYKEDLIKALELAHIKK